MDVLGVHSHSLMLLETLIMNLWNPMLVMQGVK